MLHDSLAKGIDNFYYPIVIIILCVAVKVAWDKTTNIIMFACMTNKHVISSYKLPSNKLASSSSIPIAGPSHALIAPVAHSLIT